MTGEIPLGKPTAYSQQYDAGLLRSIARADSRAAIGLGEVLPFQGSDIWNAWDLTWLSAAGVPRVASLRMKVPAASPNIVESKSLKLYLNSFSMTTVASETEVQRIIQQDLGHCTGSEVPVSIRSASDDYSLAELAGECIDPVDATCTSYAVDPGLLLAEGKPVREELYSHLLRSLCPVTGQPDLGSVWIRYSGPKIDRASLLQYIVSFREHNDFHEACVERMFVDLKERCKPRELTVYALYQRRGGIDINPWRSDASTLPPALRLWRQ